MCVLLNNVATWVLLTILFFFQAEDGIRDLVRSRGLGDVYKRQAPHGLDPDHPGREHDRDRESQGKHPLALAVQEEDCLLYTSDAADERSSVDLGGRRIIKKKKITHTLRLTR